MWKPVKWLGISCLLAILAVTTCLLLLTDQSRAQTGVLCVVPPGEPTGPFAACDQVFTAVQDAVDSAVAGEEIRVATGVYSDVHTRNGFDQIVYLDKDVLLQGGYQSPFNDVPDPAANPTILAANGLGRGVVVAEGTAVMIIGFHITGGDATDSGPQPNMDLGGGLYAGQAEVTLRENSIYSNTASRYNNGLGGGLAFVSSTVTMTQNTVYQNTGSQSGDFGGGGGIALSDSHFTLEDNQIMSNTALITGSTMLPSFLTLGLGGGLSLGDSFGVLRGNTIAANVGAAYADYGEGGGAYVSFTETAVPQEIIINHNIIRDNIGLIRGGDGEGVGGGIFVYRYHDSGDPRPYPPSVDINYNEVSGNIAGFNIGGSVGGLFIANETPSPYTATLSYNTIVSNAASVTGEYGTVGGMAFSGITTTLRHNQILSNTAVVSGTNGVGGGLYIINSQAEQTADIIRGNTAAGNANGVGGGLVIDGSDARLENVVVIDNRASNEGAGILLLAANVNLLHPTIVGNNGPEAIFVSDSAYFGHDDMPTVLTMTNAIISEHPIGIFVTGSHTVTVQGILWHNVPLTVDGSVPPNISIDDQFVGNPLFAIDGYHIQENSDAIGRGVAAGVALDIDNEGRPLANPALGADEFWPFKYYFPFTQQIE